MAQGLRVWDASGVLITEVTDRMTALFAEGLVTPVFNGSTYPPITVSVPGVRPSLDTWYVACTNGATAIPGTDVITIYVGQVSNPIRYSVFRR